MSIYGYFTNLCIVQSQDHASKICPELVVVAKNCNISFYNIARRNYFWERIATMQTIFSNFRFYLIFLLILHFDGKSSQTPQLFHDIVIQSTEYGVQSKEYRV